MKEKNKKLRKTDRQTLITNWQAFFTQGFWCWESDQLINLSIKNFRSHSHFDSSGVVFSLSLSLSVTKRSGAQMTILIVVFVLFPFNLYKTTWQRRGKQYG